MHDRGNRRVLVVLALCVWAGSALAEPPPSIDWVEEIRSPDADVGYDVGVDSTGGILLTGYTPGIDSDAFVAKYDSAGTSQWWRQNRTSGLGSGYRVAIDRIGNVIATGQTTGGSTGDAFLTSFDAAGAVNWPLSIITLGADIGYGVAVDGARNILNSGSTTGTLEAGPALGGQDAFLQKHDAGGMLLWSRQIGTSAADIGYSVAVDGPGNVYLTGSTSGSLFDGQYNGGQDAFLARYDPAGTLLWSRQIGTTADDYGRSAVVDGDGNIYIGGSTAGSLLGGTFNGGLGDAFVAKYDATGTLLWSRQLGTAGRDGLFDLAVDSVGNVLITGATEGSILGGQHSGANDVFLAKYDPAGALLWSLQLGTASNDYGRGIAVDNDGNVLVTGNTFGSLDGEPSGGSSDAFLIKFRGGGTVPEPGSLGLLVLAGVGLLAGRHKS